MIARNLSRSSAVIALLAVLMFPCSSFCQLLSCTPAPHYVSGDAGFAAIGKSYFLTSGPHVCNACTQGWILYVNGSQHALLNQPFSSGALPAGIYLSPPMPLSSSYEGTTIYVSMQMYIFESGWNTASPICSAEQLYFDFIEPTMFLVQPVVDCIGGLSSITLTDDPSEVGDFTVDARGPTIRYRLFRNGIQVEQGQLGSKWVSSPPSYVFGGLTGGDYTVELDDNETPHLYLGIAGFRVQLPAQGDCGVNVSPDVCLSLGSGCVGSDALRANGAIPLIEPYSALGYTYTGAQSDNTIVPGVLSNTLSGFSPMDWAVVELRSATNPAQVIHSKPALIQRDGELMGPDGDMYVSFPVPAGNYHVAVRHRNHFGVMTLNPVALGTAPRVVDLTSTFSTYGGGAMYPDVNGDGTLRYIGTNNDRDPILTAVGGTTPNNSVSNVYDRRDVNLDGVIRYTGTNNDRDPILTNVGSTTPNNTRTQQLP